MTLGWTLLIYSTLQCRIVLRWIHLLEALFSEGEMLWGLHPSRGPQRAHLLHKWLNEWMVEEQCSISKKISSPLYDLVIFLKTCCSFESNDTRICSNLWYNLLDGNFNLWIHQSEAWCEQKQEHLQFVDGTTTLTKVNKSPEKHPLSYSFLYVLYVYFCCFSQYWV